MIAIELSASIEDVEGKVIELMHLPRRNETIELRPAPSGKLHRYIVREVIHRQGRCPIVVVS